MIPVVSRKTALIVDDSAFARRNARRILEVMGFAVSEAINGSNAVILYATNAPDIVLLDRVLAEGADGLRILEQLRGINPKARIIVVTGDSQQATKRAMLDGGAAGVILKPLTENALLSVFRAEEEGFSAALR